MIQTKTIKTSVKTAINTKDELTLCPAILMAKTKNRSGKKITMHGKAPIVTRAFFVTVYKETDKLSSCNKVQKVTATLMRRLGRQTRKATRLISLPDRFFANLVLE